MRVVILSLDFQNYFQLDSMEFWKVATGVSAMLVGLFACQAFRQLRRTKQACREFEESDADEREKLTTAIAAKEEERKRKLDPTNFPQGTFWNRAEICHLALFRKMERGFDLSRRGSAYLVKSRTNNKNDTDNLNAGESLPHYCRPGKFVEDRSIITNDSIKGVRFLYWNLADGTFEIKNNGGGGGLFKRIESFQSRLVSLNSSSVRFIYSSAQGIENVENWNNQSLNTKKQYCVQIPLLKTAHPNEDNFVDLVATNWKEQFTKRISKFASHLAISDLLDPEKTSAAEFQKLFSTANNNLAQLFKTVDDTFCDRTQLPTALRQLTLHYAN